MNLAEYVILTGVIVLVTAEFGWPLTLAMVGISITIWALDMAGRAYDKQRR